MTRERVVIDTNVLISGLFSTTSTPALALEKAVTKAQLVATTETLREPIEKLLLPKFDRYVRRERRDALLQRVASLVEIVDVLQHVRASRDPKDDKFLDAAWFRPRAESTTDDRVRNEAAKGTNNDDQNHQAAKYRLHDQLLPATEWRGNGHRSFRPRTVVGESARGRAPQGDVIRYAVRAERALEG